MPQSDWNRARAAARHLRASLEKAREEGKEVREKGKGDGFSSLAYLDWLLDAAFRGDGLRVRPVRASDPLLFGAHAVLDNEAGIVWIRADADPETRRLILAHELGHKKLHHAPDECRCDETDLDDIPELADGYGPRQRRETEANVYAREFLLPAPDAHSLFETENLDARQIAARLGLPRAVVYAQLSAPRELPDQNDSPKNARAPDSESSALLDGLDPTQAAAATVARGPVLVGAGPGTGKTRTLTARALFLVRSGAVKPENLLALTFSRKAADEMRERIGAVDPEIAARAAITTFHSYGLDLLRRHWRAAKLPPKPILLSEPEAFALLERRIANVALGPLRYLHDPAFPLPDILRAIGRAKESLLTPDELLARAEAASDSKWTDVARVYELYETLLQERGAIDFADLIARALRLLESRPDVLAAERARYRQILVDEYQDVNRAGARLVQQLAGDGAGLWAVGDLRQAIYAFRGASPTNVTGFETDFPGGARAELGVNYRSRPDLVALFGLAAGEGAQTWRAQRLEHEIDTPFRITLAVAEDDIAQADGIAERMKMLVSEGVAWRDIVVLCRTRNQGKALKSLLAAREIPVEASSEGGLLARPDVRKLSLLLSRVADPDGPAKMGLLEIPGGLDLSSERDGSPRDALDILQDALWGAPRWAREIVEPGAVTSFLALAQTFRERAPILLEPGDNALRGFLEHIRRLVRLHTPLALDTDDNPAAETVRVMTVHASKGLEFPVVFLPNLSAGKFPSRPAPSLLPTFFDEPESSSDEESRLFFVALSRARDFLILSRAEKYNRFGAAPSPLLDSIASFEKVHELQWWRADESDARGIELDDDSEPAADPPTIGAAAAELYLRCPRRYAFERIERLPPGARSAYESFRRAVWAALETAQTPPAGESDDSPIVPAGGIDAALDAAWREQGPDESHPYAAFYRAEAQKIVRERHQVVRETASAPYSEKIEFLIPLKNGTVVVRPDAVAPDGALERHTLRKPPGPTDDSPAPEPRLSLLMEAADGAPVRMRFLQTGDVFPVSYRPQTRKRHLQQYEKALRGIRLRVFPAAPADNNDCASCPFFFVCERGHT